MILLSGTSNRPLAQSIAHSLGISLGKADITRFIDNECRVYVSENVADQEVFIVQSLSEVADQHLVELCLLGQAVKSLKAAKMTAVIPWMGYSKQDKEFRKGEAVSADLVARFIESAGFDEVITIELHSEAITPYFHIPVKELSTHNLLASAIQVDPKRHIVVSPDLGGQTRSDRFAKNVSLPIVHLTKSRDRKTGKVTVTGISGSVTGLDVIIFDDIINTGATAIQTAQFLKDHGAGSIVFLATHAVLAGNATSLLGDSPIDRIVVTDTIEIPGRKRFEKLTVESVSSILTSAIQNIS